jgi:hypothetical protein
MFDSIRMNAAENMKKPVSVFGGSCLLRFGMRGEVTTNEALTCEAMACEAMACEAMASEAMASEALASGVLTNEVMACGLIHDTHSLPIPSAM